MALAHLGMFPCDKVIQKPTAREDEEEGLAQTTNTDGFMP